MKIVSFVKFGLPLAQPLDSREFSEQKIKIKKRSGVMIWLGFTQKPIGSLIGWAIWLES